MASRGGSFLTSLAPGLVRLRTAVARLTSQGSLIDPGLRSVVVARCVVLRDEVGALVEPAPVVGSFDPVLVARLAAVRQALLADGYFSAGEVGEDVAPRVVELVSHLRGRVDELERQLADERAGVR